MYLRGLPEKLYAPENEQGVDDQVVDNQPGSEEAGREEPQTLRQQLEKNFEASRQTPEAAGEEKRDGKGRYTSRARQAAAEDGVVAEKPAEPQEQQQQQATQTQPPEAFSKEAKAEWANVPANVQSAILKREQDVAKGVAELKQRYTDLDGAIAPFADQIRAGGKSPAQAVQQLFAWFNALANNPKEAFPALAKSFNYEFAQQQAQPQDQSGQQQPPGEIPPAVQQYITNLEQKVGQMAQTFEQKLGAVENTFAAQNMAKTNEILANWSKDKPHFESVRETMAQLIQSGAVPLNNGQVDLDRAYDAAIWAIPDVRIKVLAEQEAAKAAEAKKKQEAERQAQQQQADKARKAGVSAAGGAPGAPNAQQGKPKGKGKTVRESLMEAREQLSN